MQWQGHQDSLRTAPVQNLTRRTRNRPPACTHGFTG